MNEFNKSDLSTGFKIHQGIKKPKKTIMKNFS